jgi:hypothetical protein
MRERICAMGLYKASAKIILTIDLDCQGDGDLGAISDATAKASVIMERVKSGEVSLNDLVYMQNISVDNLRRTG